MKEAESGSEASPEKPSGGWIDKVLDFLGLERNILVMTGSSFVKGLGTWLWSGYLGKVLESLGARGVMIGTFGTFSRIISIGFSFLGGALSDRLGRGRAVISATLIGFVGYLVYVAAPVWWAFLPGSLLITASTQFAFMGSLAMLGETVDQRRRTVSLASQRIIAYFPAVVSPPLGGLLMTQLGVVQGFRISMAITIGLTLASIYVQKRYYRLPPPAAERLSLDFLATWRAMSADLKRLLLANSLAFFGSGMTHLFRVLYVMDVMGVSALRYGFLQALETVSMMILIVPIGRLADRGGNLGRKRFTALDFFFNGLFSLLIPLVPSANWFYLVFLLPGVRESLEPARKALLVDLAGKGEHGRVIGFYFFLLGLINFPASFLAGLLWEWRPGAPFLVGGSITMVGFLLMMFYGPGVQAEKAKSA